MGPVTLFDLVSRHVSWATFRQTVLTSNIANANTPGYEAQDVKPFADVLQGAGLAMTETSPGHMGPVEGGGGALETTSTGSFDTTLSGNSVSVEQELMKADDVSRTLSLDLSIQRAFHRMILSSVRTGA